MRDQQDVLVHYITDMHDEGKREVFVMKALPAVRQVFREGEGHDQRPFDSKLVKDTREACRQSLDARSVVHYITVAACLVAYDCVFPSGEYCEPTGSKAACKDSDHKVLAQNVGFVIRGTAGAGSERVIMGIQALRLYLGKWGTPGYSTACVLRVELHTLSGKRQQTRIGVKVVGRRTDEESETVDRIVLPLGAGNAIDGDGMFTRRPNPQLPGKKGTGQEPTGGNTGSGTAAAAAAAASADPPPSGARESA
jgi:hypothetical protein